MTRLVTIGCDHCGVFAQHVECETPVESEDRLRERNPGWWESTDRRAHLCPTHASHPGPSPGDAEKVNP